MLNKGLGLANQYLRFPLPALYPYENDDVILEESLALAKDYINKANGNLRDAQMDSMFDRQKRGWEALTREGAIRRVTENYLEGRFATNSKSLSVGLLLSTGYTIKKYLMPNIESPSSSSAYDGRFIGNYDEYSENLNILEK